MTGFQGQVPAALLVTAFVAVLLGAALTTLLGWHGIRRLFDLPRVPRPRVTYLTLSTLWAGLVTMSVAAIAMIVLLRDHRAVDGRTQLAEVRCEAVSADQLRMDVVTSAAAAPQSFELRGDACVVWVKQVEVRPGFAFLGARAVSRIDGVGSTPRQNGGSPDRSLASRSLAGITGLVVRRMVAVPLSVPPDAQKRRVVVSPPGSPELEPTGPALTGL